MNLDPGSGRATPELSSGRASPILRQWRNQLNSDDHPTAKDKTFRRYAAIVDKALSVFETSLEEWADYISFLNRLLKALQARQPTMITVPSKAIVAQRLAQCLNPQLPSGVHQKALEVYSYIFDMISTEGLAHDLLLYLPGLANTFAFGSLSVRSMYLDLMEKYFLVLPLDRLRPATRSLILGLLPGLEDETSEDFDRMVKLMDRFKTALRLPGDGEEFVSGHAPGDSFFWQVFFLASITGHNRRPGALAYMIRALPKLGGTLDSRDYINAYQRDQIPSKLQEMVTTPEPGLLLRAFAAGLTDEQMLIQRGFLDLLVTHLPLHSPILKTVTSADFELLMKAAVGVVTRRDMSLNRRLWAWLLGPDPMIDVEHEGEDVAVNSPPPSATHNSRLARTAYFLDNGKDTLVCALLSMINEERPDLTVTERARPFRICSSLMDRWEVASLIDRELFLPIIENVRKFQETAPKAEFNEVLRSASVFFDTLDPGLIFAFIGDLLEQGLPLVRSGACIPKSLILEPDSVGIIEKAQSDPAENSRRLDRVKLATFIVNNFNVREEEMITVHAPLVVASALCLVQSRTFGQRDNSIPMDIMEEAFAIIYSLVDLIPNRAYPEIRGTQLEVGDNIQIPRDIISWYREHNGNIDDKPAPVSSAQVEAIIIKIACDAFKTSLQWPNNVNIVVRRCQLVTLILSKVQVNSSMANDLIDLKNTIKNVLDTNPHVPHPTFQAMMVYWAQFQRIPPDVLQKKGSGHSTQMVPVFVKHAWSYLAAGDPKYHVEAVRTLWLLQTILGPDSRDIEAALCSLMIACDKTGSFASRPPDSGRSFSVLWSHTLQDHASERRGSRIVNTAGLVDLSKTGAAGQRLAGADNFHIMLMQPLMLILDSLLDERTQLYMTTKAWLNNAIGLDRLLFLFVLKFIELPFLRDFGPVLTAAGQQEPEISDNDDLDMCLYLLRTLSNTLRVGPAMLWSLISSTNVNDASTYGNISAIVGKEEVTMQEFFATICMRCISRHRVPENPVLQERASQLCRISLVLLMQFLRSENAEPLAGLKLEDKLITRLQQALDGSDPYIQVLILEAILLSLKLTARTLENTPESPTEDRQLLAPEPGISKRPSSSGNLPPTLPPTTPTSLKIPSIVSSTPPPPPALIKCLQAGLGSQNSRPVLDSWVSFLSTCLPLYENSIFQVLIPLVETLCTQISESFQSLRALYGASHVETLIVSKGPESTLISLINGLEDVLSAAHAQLLAEEKQVAASKSPDQPQGFFGNLVPGVFTSDAQHGRSAIANDRLTVYLAFQDAVRVCFRIWSWGQGSDASGLDQSSTASFAYTSLRMRNRARRLLEQLFAAETLECLETVIEIWRKAYDTPAANNKLSLPYGDSLIRTQQVIKLFPALDGSRPKNTMPALFDAIYSRTNPLALDPSRKSTLTISLLDVDLAIFLNEYAHSLDDDAMDEIWTDCMTFIKDILANPFPHRQILPLLMEFAATLSEKVENTNFGELRKMRRELGDVFLRLLTAIFTTRPLTYSEPVPAAEASNGANPSSSEKADDVVGLLADIVPKLPRILVESERTLSAASTISINVFQPLLRSKYFPEGITSSTLRLFKELARVPQNQKNWRKDVGDAFNDSRFFSCDLSLVESEWMPLLKQWVHVDKDRMPELLTRLTSPTTAGIVFGVGATSARLDADRKTQLNLRRIATLILASGEDTFAGDLDGILAKIIELLGATATSSPSSATRAEIYMVLIALVLRTSAVHLAKLWPVVNTELLAALTSVVSADGTAAAETYPVTAVMQACKLLDLLLCVSPDDFQLHQWLFITDTIDAIYRPDGYTPVSLADELAEDIRQVTLGGHTGSKIFSVDGLTKAHKKRPIIGDGGIPDELMETRTELMMKVLLPFFGHLSIYAFESTYAMKPLDRDWCVSSLLRDIFDDRTIVKAM